MKYPDNGLIVPSLARAYHNNNVTIICKKKSYGIAPEIIEDSKSNLHIGVKIFGAQLYVHATSEMNQKLQFLCIIIKFLIINDFSINNIDIFAPALPPNKALRQMLAAVTLP